MVRICSLDMVNTVKLCLVFLILISVVSCSNKNSETASNLKMEEAPADTLSMEKSDFLQELDALMENTDVLKQKLAPSLSISPRPVQNIHYPEVTDTVITYSFKSSEILIYQATGNRFCQGAAIQDPEIPLPMGMKIGLSMASFLEKTGFSKKARVYRLHGEGVRDQCFFTFMQGELFRVDYLPYWD